MTSEPEQVCPYGKPRLAIIGGGSSGLICLKHALEFLPDWEVVCFEKTDRITGCWGNPYPGFVSTSTKYTTQFSCYPKFDASVRDDAGASRAEFFREGEYGEYLEAFADHFELRPHVRLRHRVENLRRATDGQGWAIEVTDLEQADVVIDAAEKWGQTLSGSDDGPLRSTTGRGSGPFFQPSTSTTEKFDCVIVCTGLAAQAKPLDSTVPTLSAAELNQPDGLGHVTGKTIVVVGGGESAVDYANRLAKPELGNNVYLSLKSGIRVSPRYHPIRGVPSDFLRNRLMLSIHPDLRNWIGEGFVRARILFQPTFERLFPASGGRKSAETGQDATSGQVPAIHSAEQAERKKDWTFRLTKAAKDDLFNMFHNKSDDFLAAVADQRINIIGPPVDETFTTFHGFDDESRTEVTPDLVVPAIGYRATLDELSGGKLKVSDFYQGCCHVEHDDLYLVGFARPIIGNIPSISEVQARYVCGLIAGKFTRPPNVEVRHRAQQKQWQTRYDQLNHEAVYPVEMFPYCDALAREMEVFATPAKVKSLWSWWQMQLAPATTLHYRHHSEQELDPSTVAPIYMPPLLIALLLMLKPVDWVYRLVRLVLTRSV